MISKKFSEFENKKDNKKLCTNLQGLGMDLNTDFTKLLNQAQSTIHLIPKIQLFTSKLSTRLLNRERRKF